MDNDYSLSACNFVISRLTSTDLVAIAHRMLEAGLYSEATIALAYLPTDRRIEEAGKLYPQMCVDLKIPIPSRRQATLLLLQAQVLAMASEHGDLRSQLREIWLLLDAIGDDADLPHEFKKLMEELWSQYYYIDDALDLAEWHGLTDEQGTLLVGKAAYELLQNKVQQWARQWIKRFEGLLPHLGN